jgi:hypothetical protein
MRRFKFLSNFPSGVSLFSRCFLISSLPMGWLRITPGGRLRPHPLIDCQSLPGELLKNDAVDPVHRLFGQTPPETGKVGNVTGEVIDE